MLLKMIIKIKFLLNYIGVRKKVNILYGVFNNYEKVYINELLMHDN